MQRSDIVSQATAVALGLTRREAEVLVLVGRGRTNVEIADALFVSPRTVQKHLQHVYAKLGVESRTAAVARAFEAAVLAPDEERMVEA
jgi:DNA-binding CsgD family transcriptional regulator